MEWMLALLFLADNPGPFGESIGTAADRLRSELPTSLASDRAILSEPPKGFRPGAPFILLGQAADEAEWSIRTDAVVRGVQGSTLVRENAIQGTRINLRRDLGLELQEGGRVSGVYETRKLVWLLDVEYLEGSGRQPDHRSFFFNGYQFAAGDPIHTLTHFLTVRLQVEWKGVYRSPDGAWFGPVVGLEFPYYYMNVTSKANPHNSEDWTHNYPYPVIGWGGRLPVAEGLSLEGRTTVGYFPNLPSAFTEGGRLYVSSRPGVWVDLPLVWKVSRTLRLSLGFQYQYWNGGDHSIEDGNKLRFSGPGATLGAEFAW